jgi:hypothetical protein
VKRNILRTDSLNLSTALGDLQLNLLDRRRVAELKNKMSEQGPSSELKGQQQARSGLEGGCSILLNNYLLFQLT